MVLVVTDVEASTLPFMRLVNLVLLIGVDERFHANWITAVVFLQIVDVEANSMAFPDVSNWKEVPLRVVERVVIEIQIQIVLALTIRNALNFAQVSRLKLRVEEYRLLVYVVYVKRLRWIC